MNELFIAVGFLGIAGASFLLPPFARLFKKKINAQNHAPTSFHFDICIPAHNEENVISQSLSSMRAAANELKKLKPEAQIRILLACDGCTDQTANLAKPLVNILIEQNPSKGKWQTLSRLTQDVSADWIIFADAGAIWPKDFFSQSMLDLLQKPNLMGISLSYRPQNVSLIEKLYWKIETWIKKNEEYAGGPISVSGFTCVYKKECLISALDELQSQFPNQNWLNDDVVLPLWLRTRLPDNQIATLELTKPLDDLGLRSDAQTFASEWRRRKRLARGNLQWMKTAWPMLRAQSSFATQLLVWRRCLKVFWALWLSFFLIGLSPYLYGFFLTALIVFTPLSKGVRKLSAAFAASLLAIFEYVFKKSQNELWK